MTDRPFIWWRNLVNLEKITALYKGNMIEAEINIESKDNQIIADRLESLCSHSRIDGFLLKLVIKKANR